MAVLENQNKVLYFPPVSSHSLHTSFSGIDRRTKEFERTLYWPEELGFSDFSSVNFK